MYAKVDLTNQKIIAGPMALPPVYDNRNGTVDLLVGKTDTELLAMNWVPYNYTNAAPSKFEKYTAINHTWYADRVEATYVKEYLPLATIRDIRNEEINELRDVFKYGGITWGSNDFDTDEVSLQNMTAVSTRIGLGYSVGANFVWRSANNINVPMDDQDVKDLGGAFLDWVNQCYGVSWYHKSNLDALTTAGDIIAYDINVGWPSNVY